MTDNAAHLPTAEGPSTLAPAARPRDRRSQLDRLKWHTGTVDLDRVRLEERRSAEGPRSLVRHLTRDTWITVASALVVTAALALQDWQAIGREPYFHRFLVMDAITGLVLTPLLVATFLTLRSCIASLLLRLHRNEVVDPAGDSAGLRRFSWTLDRRLDRLLRPAAIATVLYIAYALVDGLDDLGGPVTALLFLTALAIQATLFLLGVLTVLQIWTVCRAVGRLVRQPGITVWPLHPDGCGGLWPVGHVLSFVLYFAAILGGAGLCMFLALPSTPSALTRRPEPYLLAVFYAILLPSALVNVLLRPHELLVERRRELLTAVAVAFNDAIGAAGSLTAGDPARLRAATDRLSEISRHGRLLDEACPAWPLPLRRLRPTLVTAVLPILIPVVTTVITRLVTAGP